MATPRQDFSSFSIDAEPLRDAVRVCPSGELDMATGGWQIAVIDGADPVRRAFDVTGLRRVIPFVERRSLQTGRVWR